MLCFLGWKNHKIYLLWEMKNWSKERSFGDEWNWEKKYLFLHFSFLIASNFPVDFLLLLRNWINLISQYTNNKYFLTLVEVKFFIESNKNEQNVDILYLYIICKLSEMIQFFLVVMLNLLCGKIVCKMVYFKV